MKDFIQKTLAEIDEQIAALEELRDGIKRHFEKDADAKERQERPAVLPVPAQEKREKKKAARKPRKKVKESDLEGKSEGEMRFFA